VKLSYIASTTHLFIVIRYHTRSQVTWTLPLFGSLHFFLWIIASNVNLISRITYTTHWMQWTHSRHITFTHFYTVSAAANHRRSAARQNNLSLRTTAGIFTFLKNAYSWADLGFGSGLGFGYFPSKFQGQSSSRDLKASSLQKLVIFGKLCYNGVLRGKSKQYFATLALQTTAL